MKIFVLMLALPLAVAFLSGFYGTDRTGVKELPPQHTVPTPPGFYPLCRDHWPVEVGDTCESPIEEWPYRVVMTLVEKS
jgi:hypothetical protein